MWSDGGGDGGVRRLGAGAPAATGRATRAGRAVGRFHLTDPAAPDQAASAAAATALPPAGPGLLALQEHGGNDARDTEAHRRGTAMLDALRQIQAEMLGDRCDPVRLSRLAALAEGECGADPRLREALAAIALRARVELVRLRIATAESQN